MNMERKKLKKFRLSFFVSENKSFLFIAVFFAAVLIGTYFYCEITADLKDIINAVTTAVLASVMLPLGLNYGKIRHERRILKDTCESIINNSIFLLRGLNYHLAQSGKKPFSCYSDLQNKKVLATVNFENFKTFDELFLLIPDKLDRIANMEYMINKTDVFEWAVKKVKDSIPVATKEKNYYQLFRDLTIVVGIIGHIQAPFFADDYIKQFNDGLQKSCKEIEYIYFQTTDDYIVQCLENDLSEQETRYKT